MEKYSEIARSKEFHKLKQAKMLFIWPVVILFLLYYLSLPLMAGYAKSLMGSYVFGYITFGYLYGVLFYFVAWGLAFWYVRKARQFDRRSEALLNHYNEKKGA